MLAKYAPIRHVLAFPGGRGTAHMIETARKAGVVVITEFPVHKTRSSDAHLTY